MSRPRTLGYSFLIALPSAVDQRLRRWTAATEGASWDVSGGHITLARLTGDLPPADLIPAFQSACRATGGFDVALCAPLREAYWDKPGLEIVMLVGEKPSDVAGVLALRERLLADLCALDVELAESGPYLPHVTLTTGLPPTAALGLEAAASDLELRFRAREVVMWSGGETPEEGDEADPPWRPIERAILA